MSDPPRPYVGRNFHPYVGRNFSSGAAQFSRRDLLKALPVAALAGASACRRGPRPYDPARFAHPSTSTVALLPAARYDLDLSDVVERGLALLNMNVRGMRVLLKPNMVEYAAGRVINTHPALVAGAAQAMLRAGAASVVVAEGPGHRRDIEYLVTATGLYDYLRDVGVAFRRSEPRRRAGGDVGEPLHRPDGTAVARGAAPGRPGRVDAEAQDASLGRHDGQHEEPLRRRARRRLRLAEEHPPLARDRQLHRRPGGDHPARPGHRRRRSSAWRATAPSWALRVRLAVW